MSGYRILTNAHGCSTWCKALVELTGRPCSIGLKVALRERWMEPGASFAPFRQANRDFDLMNSWSPLLWATNPSTLGLGVMQVLVRAQYARLLAFGYEWMRTVIHLHIGTVPPFQLCNQSPHSPDESTQSRSRVGSADNPCQRSLVAY